MPPTPPSASRAGNRLDARLGDWIDQAVTVAHRRRLGRHGWAGALAPHREQVPGPPDWVDAVPIREGNAVEVLIDGAATCARIAAAIESATSHVHIAGWHTSPHFRLTPGGPPLRDLLAAAATRVPVRLLMWAGAPLPIVQPTRPSVLRDRMEFVRDSRVECQIDTRGRMLHCHHEKIVVVDDETAIIGGLDLTDLEGDRNDDQGHPHADRLGWHDVSVVIRGPAVADIARHVVHRWRESTGHPVVPDPLVPPEAGEVPLQVVRTVPEKAYDFLPHGDFSVLAAYLQALRAAERLVYLENQFLWSPEIADVLAAKLDRPPHPDFRILLVLPRRPSNGKDTTRGQLAQLIDADADRGRLLATTVLGPTAASPGVYVHAKVGIVDDRWLTIGSANLNTHSLFNDSELNVLTLDPGLARSTRIRLWSEHLRLPQTAIDGPPTEVIDTIWRAQCDIQDEVSARGEDPVHRIRRISGLSHRMDRLVGPVRGLLIDG